MQVYNLEVSKKVNGQYEKVGDVAINYPMLSELGFDVEPTGKDDDGLPTYSDEKAQYVFDAVFANVKAAARNKLVSGTATLKDGNKIAETVAELLTTGERNGAALQNLRDLLAIFKEWLPKTGKDSKTQAALYDLVSNRKALGLASDVVKGKVANYIAQFAESLDGEQATKYERILVALNDACESVNALDDL
jgi:hypothetical protein